MNVAASPTRLGIAATATSIAVLVTACNSDPGEDGDAVEADSTEGSEDGPSLSDPGILTMECSDESFVATLFSDESGEEITRQKFSIDELTGEEVPGFPAGRSTDSRRVSLRNCSDNADQYLIPEHGVVLVTVREQVEGTEAKTVGVLDSEGNVSVLTEEQNIGDFDEPTTFSVPRYDAAQDRILYLEPDPESSDDGNNRGLFHQVDLSSGETAEAFECTFRCQTLWTDQKTGLLSWRTGAVDRSPGVLTSPDGAVAVNRDGNLFWNVDNPTEVTVVNSELDESSPDGATLDVWDVYFAGPEHEIAAFISDTEIVLADNELSVIEVGESEIGPLSGEDMASTPKIPVAYSLVPDSPRDNGEPAVSPELDEAVFISTTDSGEASWYRVPTDGSTDPTEIAPVPEGREGVRPISWT